MNKFKELVDKYSKNKISIDPEKISLEISNITIDEVFSFYKSFFSLWKEKDFDIYKNEINFILKKGNSLNVKFVKKVNESNFINSIFTEKENRGVKDLSQLYSSVDGSLQTASYYNDELMTYAICWFRIICNHPFNNGNKRTGFIAVKTNLIIDIVYNLLQIVEEIFVKNFYTINHSPISSILIKKIQKHYNDEKKIFIKKTEENILNSWIKSGIHINYILSMWIVNFKQKENSELRNRIYEIIEIDLILFLLNNQKIIINNIDSFNKNFNLSKTNKF